ncbi:iron complex transport system substrate-binding protein [Pseudomonas duriflava]|uniref:Iron complex transport system substrate-binding protein n=1 Tax=Pseudomonas duriflava TaxID=459528 RepID=A0A562QL04_9PSED|nr:iron-siderophore ABC transporter substrate-binding protein [Pseudomonas duriflava]TWI57458.1 iron complex transport system substrate-binding protein [Pseudomonas duriflava]
MLDRRTFLRATSAAMALTAAAPALSLATVMEPASEQWPRRVNHLLGKTLIPHAPRRVVAISTGQLDGLLTLGLVPVGVTRVDNHELTPGYLQKAFPEQREALAQITDLGGRGSPDIETLAQLAPDLILLNKTALKFNGYQLYSRIAPTVVTRGYGANWRHDFLIIANALGRAHEAHNWLARLDSDMQRFASSQGSRPPTVSFLFASGPRLRLMCRGSLVGGLSDALNLARPHAQQFKGNSLDISPERLDMADADWLFYADQGSGLASLKKQPLWNYLEAVRNRRAIRIDADAFYLNAGPSACRHIVDTLTDTVRPI